MIAKQEHHYGTETLQKLLEDSLPPSEAIQLETHLSRCDLCRNDLKELAGSLDWWTETAEVLFESKTHVDSAAQPQTSAIESSLQWIRPLLAPATSGGIGMIDDFPIHGVIGQGGMGVVLRGTDLQLNRPIALKILSPHLAGVGAARARFMREAQAAAAIVHPSIVPIYRVVTSAALPYIVMPCIAGGNLQQRIDREGPLEISEVLRIGRQIAEGLAAAHRHGVIHRDIKPANVLIEEGNGRVLISDFGLARALDDASLTVSGMIAGTPQYMSPEQARGESIDARSDLFSLGSLLFTLATGRPPFRAESPLAVLRKVSESRPRPIHQINERMPPWLDALVGRFMQIDVDGRIKTADDAAKMLAEAHAHVVNPSTNLLPAELMPPRNSKAMVVIAAGCIVLFGLLLGFALSSQTSTASSPRIPKLQSFENTATTEGLFPWADEAMMAELQSIDLQLSQLEQTLIHSPLLTNP